MTRTATVSPMFAPKSKITILAWVVDYGNGRRTFCGTEEAANDAARRWRKGGK